jgi:hypothetical protein
LRQAREFKRLERQQAKEAAAQEFLLMTRDAAAAAANAAARAASRQVSAWALSKTCCVLERPVCAILI